LREISYPFQLTVPREIECSLAEAWSAWANPAELSTWFTTEARQDFRVGGRYVNADHDSGTFLEIVPRCIIRFSWEQPQHQPGSQVRVEFKELTPKLTEVRLTHERLGSDEEVANLTEGWSWALDSLKNYLEKNEPIAFDQWKAAKK
jgi:uncharacterized protein YndB with AHSA1/START domain